MKESAIEQHLVARVHRIGGECYKFVSPNHAGVPDRVVVLPGGEVVWVELKTPKGVVSEIQKRTHLRLKELDQDVQVFRHKWQIDKHFPIE